MELEKPDTANLKTGKQEQFVFQLIQSTVFSKREFEGFYKFILPKVETSLDASIVIDYLLSTIKLRKRFYRKKMRCHLKCMVCGVRDCVQRFFNVKTKKQMLICDTCDERMYSDEHNGISDFKDNPAKDAEVIEASADLHRKYDIEDHSVDDAVEEDKRDKSESVECNVSERQFDNE